MLNKIVDRLGSHYIWICRYLFINPIMLISFALYKELHDGILVCELCWLQRVGLLGVAVSIFEVLLWLKSGYRQLVKIFLYLAMFFTISTVIVAAYNVLIQYTLLGSFCGENFGAEQDIYDLPYMVVDCKVVNWKFLGVTAPLWNVLNGVILLFLEYIVLKGYEGTMIKKTIE